MSDQNSILISSSDTPDCYFAMGTLEYHVDRRRLCGHTHAGTHFRIPQAKKECLGMRIMSTYCRLKVKIIH